MKKLISCEFNKAMIDDVNASGMDGLFPHLIGEARATVDAVSSVTENNIFNTIVGFIGQSEYASVLKSEIQEIKWKVDELDFPEFDKINW